MNIICRGRRGGKTVEAIKLAAETWSYIVCINRKEADRVFDVSKKLGIDIPNPITIEDFIGKRYYAKGIRGFIIDNADMCLQSLTTVPINAITITGGSIEPDYVKEQGEKAEIERKFYKTEVLAEWGKDGGEYELRTCKCGNSFKVLKSDMHPSARKLCDGCAKNKLGR